MENTFGIRLSSARKMAGMSLQKLADALGNVVTRQSLNKYEQGKMRPDSGLLIKLSEILKVPVDYFFSKPAIAINFKNPDYRKHSSRISKTEKTAIEEKSKHVLERYFELEQLLQFREGVQYFDYEPVIRNEEDAEEAAAVLREDWQLGYDPIPDVIGMLEDKGYLMVEIEASSSFDGLAVEVNDKKLIILNSSVFAENNTRKRFTALHELAHHSLKIADQLDHKHAERLCHVFASAVLYPEDMARKELHHERFHFYENELVILKEKWGISISAIFYRAHKLGIISDYVLRKLNITYRSRGYHKDEPGRFLGQEKPLRFIRFVYFALSKEIISINEAAYLLDKSVWEFREELHQLA